jgi:hypothetical protein
MTWTILGIGDDGICNYDYGRGGKVDGVGNGNSGCDGVGYSNDIFVPWCNSP